ncbi:hypothetical protein ES708_23398 [subsurface metagenome]
MAESQIDLAMRQVSQPRRVIVNGGEIVGYTGKGLPKAVSTTAGTAQPTEGEYSIPVILPRQAGDQ